MLMCATFYSRAQVSIADHYIYALPPSVPNSAAYGSLLSDQDDVLISAECEGVEEVQIHEILEQNGMLKMRPISGLTLPKDKEVLLQPGGYHLMLIHLISPFLLGDTVSCILHFKHAMSEKVSFSVIAR